MTNETRPPMFDRVVTHERAMEAAHRLVNSHFRQEPHARASIPASADDDDIVITDYITQQTAAALEAKVTALRARAEAADNALRDYHRDAMGTNLVWFEEAKKLAARAEQAEEQLKRCGKENCFGYEVGGAASWVRKERLEQVEAELGALKANYPLVVERPCRICGEVWPYPAVLSTTPPCGNCGKEAIKERDALRTRLEAAEAYINEDGWLAQADALEQSGETQ